MRMICSEAARQLPAASHGHLAQEEVNGWSPPWGSSPRRRSTPTIPGRCPRWSCAAKARRLKKERGIGMIIVDYLQLMQRIQHRQNSENRVQEVSEISAR